ncbi:hypothetical protein ACH4E8_28380 [Streptomyces sp. NPDC017979]|uniref:hypothetical protein n=1 Tax=Streptomyces sp. NPDC017979 TaxID=3365024 RepID=UPI0037ACC45E
MINSAPARAGRPLRTPPPRAAVPRPRSDGSSRTPGWAVAVPPALLMLVFGLWGVTREGTLWGDEAVTYDMARRTVPEIWRTLGSVDAVHGLHYLLMHGVFTAWEPGLVPLRLPSVLGMSATAAGVALIGRHLAGPRAGLLAGLVLTTLPVVHRYAQEGRSYALVCALVTWGSWLLLRRRWVAYAGVMLLACLLHEFAVLTVVAHGVTVWQQRKEHRARGWVVAAGCVCAGLAPLALFSVTQSSQVEWIEPPETRDFIALVLLAALGWACSRNPAGARVRSLALPLLVLPTALLLLVSKVHPLFVDRYVLPYVVGLALLLGAALDHYWTRALAWSAVAGALVVLVSHGPFLRTPDSRKNDVGAVASAVAEVAHPGDGLLFAPARRRSYALVHAAPYARLHDVSLDRSRRASGTLFGTEASPAQVRTRMLSEPRIVAVQDLRGQPLDSEQVERTKRDVLRESFALAEERVVDQVRIGVYVRRATG